MVKLKKNFEFIHYKISYVGIDSDIHTHILTHNTTGHKKYVQFVFCVEDVNFKTNKKSQKCLKFIELRI